MPKHVTKRDLVIQIAGETGLVQQQVLDVVQKTLDHIRDAVARGETVELRNFGVFEVKLRKARIGRNPNAPQTDVPIPPRAIVKFKPGKEMREVVVRGGESRTLTAVDNRNGEGKKEPVAIARPARKLRQPAALRAAA